jgi:hypothetical protein
MRKEVTVACFEIISRHLCGGTAEINKETQSVYLVSEMRFETTTFSGRREVLPALCEAMMTVEVKLRVFLTSRTRSRRVVAFTLLPHCHREK